MNEEIFDVRSPGVRRYFEFDVHRRRGSALTPDSADIASAFLSDVAERMQLPGDHALIRTVMGYACGGQLDARGPDGRRASTLTSTGTPLEVSVSGGGGEFTPAVRYVTETATQETTFAARLAAQLTAVQHLVTLLPNGDEIVAEMFRSFVSILYPDPATIPRQFRSSTWLGLVHHAAAPQHIARLKVYGFLRAAPGSLDRLRGEMPGFEGLAAVSDDDGFFVPVGAGLEVDAHGNVNHKVYLRTRHKDVAAPMRLVRRFGDRAWEVLSEFVRCGVDAATFYRYQFFICCAQSAGTSTFAITLAPRRRQDLTPLVGEVALRHFGTTVPVDALARAAAACGATWSYSGVGLGFSAAGGIEKLNVYGTPTWEPTTV